MSETRNGQLAMFAWVWSVCLLGCAQVTPVEPNHLCHAHCVTNCCYDPKCPISACLPQRTSTCDDYAGKCFSAACLPARDFTCDDYAGKADPPYCSTMCVPVADSNVRKRQLLPKFLD